MVSALLLVAALLPSDFSAVAALPGEPSIVSAAAVTAHDDRVLTLEHPFALDPAAKKRRLVLVGSDNAADGAAVLDLVRWFKTAAPRAIRDRWLVSALPAAPAGADLPRLARWVDFQDPDLLAAIGDVPTWQTHASIALQPANARRELLRELRKAQGRAAGPGAYRARTLRDPLSIAKLLAANYPGTPSISYIPSVAWANTLTLARLVDNPDLRAKVERQTAPWRTEAKDLFGSRIQLTSVAGTFVFAELGARDAFERGLEAASKVKDDDTYEFGQGWTDDMFMATVVLARGGRTELASRMLIAYASRLQRADGVFVHAPNGPVAWGRGNGFAALGLAEALGAMDARDPNRARVLEIYRRQMTAARALQAPDGMWNEVLDEPGSYREESATAMLMTAMSRGIRAGWLDRTFVPAAERAWRGVAAHVAEDGTVVDVCTSTGAGPTKRYYLDRTAVTGADDRGGAMALMAAVEIDALRHAPAVAAK